MKRNVLVQHLKSKKAVEISISWVDSELKVWRYGNGGLYRTGGDKTRRIYLGKRLWKGRITGGKKKKKKSMKYFKTIITCLKCRGQGKHPCL